ncbi:MAG TPA: hypothetical protein VFU04_03455 [Solirubrobacterales bacterium]|nr:hypothetical protein [Solirubrobacterales bacterium]
MPLGTLFLDAAVGAGLLAAAIAVGGFLAHAGPTFFGATEREIREATVIGGLAGLFLAIALIVLSAYLGSLST